MKPRADVAQARAVFVPIGFNGRRFYARLTKRTAAALLTHAAGALVLRFDQRQNGYVEKA